MRLAVQPPYPPMEALLVDHIPIGVIAFYFTAPVNFDDEYRELLISVAQDCAQALDRARLYESAEAAVSAEGRGRPEAAAHRTPSTGKSEDM